MLALDREVSKCMESVRAETRDIQSDVPLRRLIEEIDGLAGRDASALLPAPAARFLTHAIERFGACATGAYAKLLVLTLIAESDSRIRRLALPEAVRTSYPRILERIARGLIPVPNAAYVAAGGDFERDLRLASQLSVPMNASRHMDRSSFIDHSFYRGQGKAQNLRSLMFLVLRLRGLGPLFRVHIDERDLADFSDAGWEQCYLRIAEMLRLNPAVKGVVGTSWTLDPQLDGISPRLTHPRRQHVAHGAFLHCDGPGEIHTRRATGTSATRRRLYEEGKYRPACYTFVWPRQDVLEWAATVSRPAQPGVSCAARRG